MLRHGTIPGAKIIRGWSECNTVQIRLDGLHFLFSLRFNTSPFCFVLFYLLLFTAREALPSAAGAARKARSQPEPPAGVGGQSGRRRVVGARVEASQRKSAGQGRAARGRAAPGSLEGRAAECAPAEWRRAREAGGGGREAHGSPQKTNARKLQM